MLQPFHSVLGKAKLWLEQSSGQEAAIAFSRANVASSLNSAASHSSTSSTKALGRRVLHKALHALALPLPQEPILWPLPYASVSHCVPYAVAIAVKPCLTRGKASIKGLGVDLELWRPLTQLYERFYLTPQEQACLHALKLSSQALEKERLRLWSLKEAVFKAYPHNAKLELLDFELQADCFKQPAGTACLNLNSCTDSDLLVFHLISFCCEEGVLAMATL